MTATTVSPTLIRTLITSSNLNSAQVQTVLDLPTGTSGNNTERQERFGNFINGACNRTYPMTTVLNIGATKATATVTISSTGPTNTEAFTLGNVTITGVTSGSPTNNQFTVSTTPATAAANLAKCINASTSFTNTLTATSALGVVTITASTPGLVGNLIQIDTTAGTLANTAVTAFVNGAEGNNFTISQV